MYIFECGSIFLLNTEKESLFQGDKYKDFSVINKPADALHNL